jgi:hypothetical protein
LLQEEGVAVSEVTLQELQVREEREAPEAPLITAETGLRGQTLREVVAVRARVVHQTEEVLPDKLGGQELTVGTAVAAALPKLTETPVRYREVPAEVPEAVVGQEDMPVETELQEDVLLLILIHGLLQ